MPTSDLYTTNMLVAKMLNNGAGNGMDEKDYVKVVKVFFQLQFLVTKLVVSGCYNFLEKVSEIQNQETSSVDSTPRRFAKVAATPPAHYAKENSLPVEDDVTEKKSIMMAPLDTVKAGLSFTGMVATAPMQVASYAAHLSWGVVSKVSQASRNLIRRTSASEDEDPKAKPTHMDQEAKRTFVRSLLQAKELCGKSFAQISDECGITSVYCAQLFHNQAQLKPDTAICLKRSVPTLSDQQLYEMAKAPMRTYDPRLTQEPSINRLNEAVLQYGESIKALINEECGDGVMSDVDFFATVDKIRTSDGEERIQVSFNGKFVPHPEQRNDNSLMYE